MMEGYAEANALLPRRFAPLAQKVAVRPHVDRVPWLILRVPVIEVVVVYSLYQKEASTGLFIQVRKPNWIEPLRVPLVDHIDIAGL